MSHISKLKLSSQPMFQAAKLSQRDRLRLRVVEHLEQQKLLVDGVLTGKPYVAYKAMTRVDASGERIRVQEPRHVRRGWFEDTRGVVFFAIRYGAKSLMLDKTNSAIEVGPLKDLPGLLDVMIDAVKAGELDTQLAAAAQDRRKNFTKRPATKG
jgi:hypothetical protein